MEYLKNILYWGCLDISNNYAEDIVQNELTEKEISELNRSDIPAFDRWISFCADKDLKAMSDYTYAGLLASSLILTFDKTQMKQNIMVLSQILLVQSAVGKWVKTLTARKRPYVYCKESSGRNQNSFYSLHSSGAFAIATYSYYFFSKASGKNLYVAALLYGGAGLTAALRVASAQHFPSDIAAGAVIGSCISYLLCKTYSDHDLSLSISSDQIGISLRY